MKKLLLLIAACLLGTALVGSASAQTFFDKYAKRFVLGDASSTPNTVTLSLPASVTSYTILFPPAQGTGYLKNDGAGNLSFVNATLSGSNTGDVTLAGENYLTIAAQVITAHPINLAGTNVTGLLGPTNGGTGVNNGTNTITLGGNMSTGGTFTTTPANNVTFTTTGPTNVTLPTSGTLVASSGALGASRVVTTDGSGVLTTFANGTGYLKNNGSGTLIWDNLTISGSNSGDVTLAGENYLTIAAQVITAHPINLASTNVTGLLGPTNGGTGVNNGTNTITLGGNMSTGGTFTTTPANNVTFTTTGPTNVTLPTTGTLVASSGALAASSIVTTDGSGVLTTFANGTGYLKNNGSGTLIWDNLTISGSNSGDVTLAGENYLTIAGQVITAHPIDLASTNVTGLLGPTNGGTGVNNGTNTITLGGNMSTGGTFTTTPANNVTFTTTGPTNVTLPTSGTLIASAGALTAKGAVTTDASGNLVSTALTDGQIMIGSTGNVPSAATLTAGSNITITNGPGTITIASTGGGSGSGYGALGDAFIARSPTNSVTNATTNSNVAVNATGLTFPVGAGEIWSFVFNISAHGDANGVNVGLSFPSGAVMEATAEALVDFGADGHTAYYRITNSATAGSSTSGTAFTMVGGASTHALLSEAADGGMRIAGVIDNTSGSAGSVQLVFADAASGSASQITMYKNSFVNAWQFGDQTATRDQTYTSGSSFVVPTGVTSMYVSGVGGAGGGGGGGADANAGANQNRGGAGGSGGAGEYIPYNTVTVVPGETLTITIGTGGTAGAGGIAAGNVAAVGGGNGGNTTISGSVSGTIFQANGGTGGGAGTNTVAANANGGSAGAGGVVAGSSPSGGVAGSNGSAGTNGTNGNTNINGPTGGNGPTGLNANTGGTGGFAKGGANGTTGNGGAGTAGTDGYLQIAY